jgi:hypothetical protein
VSWIRSRDLTILTIGEVRYTRDPRFTAIHSQGNNYWGLKVSLLSPESIESFIEDQLGVVWVGFSTLTSCKFMPGRVLNIMDRHVHRHLLTATM